MSKKEEKKDEKGDKGAKQPATPEQEAAASKKKKIIIFGVIGLFVLGGGAFAAIKMLGSSSKPKESTNDHGGAEAGAEGGAEGDSGHAAGEASGHSEGAAEGDAAKKGVAKAGTKETSGHGDTKAEGKHEGDGHGDAKAEGKHDGDGHGDAKAEGSGKGSGADTSDSRYAGIGIMYDFKPFHLNLGNPLENRYVRMEIRVEYPNEEQKAELTARDSQMRDAIVSIISRKTREHLLSPDGKDQLRLEIKNRLNQYLEKKIVNVYITDILIE